MNEKSAEIVIKCSKTKKSDSKMGKKDAREAAFKLVYERLVTNHDNNLSFENETSGLTAEEKDYCRLIYTQTAPEKKGRALAQQIENLASDFKLDRVYKVDFAILTTAAYEILFTQTPVKVAVNEAVVLAKKYSTEKSFKFINGILSSVIKGKEEHKGECKE